MEKIGLLQRELKLEIEYSTFVENMNTWIWSQSLEFQIQGTQNSAFLWSIGNSLIAALGIGEEEDVFTRLLLYTIDWLPPEGDSLINWNALCSLCKNKGWVESFVPITHEEVYEEMKRFKLVKWTAEQPLTKANDEIAKRNIMLAKKKIRLIDSVSERTMDDACEAFFRGAQTFARGALNELEQGIIDVVKDLRKGGFTITDEIIATQLLLKKGIGNKEGEAYTREYINKVKNGLIKRGFDI
jgi:hypothetical protein